jgi:hypothetical protein
MPDLDDKDLLTKKKLSAQPQSSLRLECPFALRDGYSALTFTLEHFNAASRPVDDGL